ncbi:MAG: elongation factor 4 [Candidatus Omnitrophica bacterium]|nr:elongation factor 4 [Candidatus Omnitrophota bacterium]
MDQDRIRNFSIIAHIDHGKSTLADRILQITKAISEREFHEQMLDDMELERERGITIKSSAVRLVYKAKDGMEYILNLIDTPGHVDFTYEVSKSIAACEGALLVVDAAQGVEAQTVANLYMAMEHNLVIIPVVNKIDLANAEPEKTIAQINNLLGGYKDKILMASAKEGTGVVDILESIVKTIPPPSGGDSHPLQALIFDSSYNTYKGAIVYVRIMNGVVKTGDKILLMRNGREYEVQELGVFTPKPKSVDQMSCGEVGYMTCNIRDAGEIEIGDTVTLVSNKAHEPLPGYRKMRPMVFSGIYPVNSKDFEALKDAMDKLSLSDASFHYEPESSAALGFGFRCGFLGLLHMEIIQERLEREYDLNLVISIPSVIYKIETTSGETINVDNPSKMPPSNLIHRISEPYVAAYVITPADSIGNIMQLAESKRGEYISTDYLSEDKAKLTYVIPLSEIIVDFYDKIKSITRGYGSLDYEFLDYKESDLVKLDILLNGEGFDAMSSIVHKDKAYHKGRAIVDKLKELIPKQLIEVAIQASIGNNIIARSTVKPLKKHVTGKCYGGDITRKRKLWEKQKEGKKKMKQFGKVQIPQEAFIAALKV